MKNEPVVIERTFNAPIAKVWKALTENEQLKQWYFQLADFKAEVGFEFNFYGGKTADQQYLHLCKVTEVIAGKKLTYSWRYDGYPGNSFVTIELFKEDEKTKLKLTHTGLETLINGNPDFERESFVKGWTHIINTSLKDYLEK